MNDKIQLNNSCKHFFNLKRSIYSQVVSCVYSCIFTPKDDQAWIATGKIPGQDRPF